MGLERNEREEFEALGGFETSADLQELSRILAHSSLILCPLAR